MKEILLTQGKITIVDDEDYERLRAFKWYINSTGYAVRSCLNLNRNNKQITILMHREILNATKGIQIDHRNGNGLDNRKENLRLCTPQQNAFNRKNAHKNNKLGIKGVHWCKREEKFVATICINNKKITLGYFNISGDADSTYRIAEEEYFGGFVRGKT